MTHQTSLKDILSEALEHVETLKAGEVNGAEFEQLARELLREVYLHLPKSLRPKLIVELKVKLLPRLQETVPGQ